MARLKTQGDDWVNRSISLPIGFIAKVLLHSSTVFPPEDLPTFMRRIVSQHIGYLPSEDWRYIRDAIKKGLLDDALVKKAMELNLLEPPPSEEEE